jgi:hypothetical protein
MSNISFIKPETNDGLKSSSYNHRKWRVTRKRGDDQRRVDRSVVAYVEKLIFGESLKGCIL